MAKDMPNVVATKAMHLLPSDFMVLIILLGAFGKIFCIDPEGLNACNKEPHKVYIGKRLGRNDPSKRI